MSTNGFWAVMNVVFQKLLDMTTRMKVFNTMTLYYLWFYLFIFAVILWFFKKLIQHTN